MKARQSLAPPKKVRSPNDLSSAAPFTASAATSVRGGPFRDLSLGKEVSIDLLDLVHSYGRNTDIMVYYEPGHWRDLHEGAHSSAPLAICLDWHMVDDRQIIPPAATRQRP
jgi:hypothetical protein